MSCWVLVKKRVPIRHGKTVEEDDQLEAHRSASTHTSPAASVQLIMASAAPLMRLPATPAALTVRRRTTGQLSTECIGLICPPRANRALSRVVMASAVGEVSADGNTYLFAGAAAVALVGTAFPLLFFRKDTCPECDGAGFVREAGAALRANAARKDQPQIVCRRCNGLGKLGQIDK